MAPGIPPSATGDHGGDILGAQVATSVIKERCWLRSISAKGTKERVASGTDMLSGLRKTTDP
ncbi:hypothetical protein NC651_030239 [Populus alba x Populus x berolinensis]|nr:hypothetical protein NC651_030239 [Populus alba x Populus x berolinensis]